MNKEMGNPFKSKESGRDGAKLKGLPLRALLGRSLNSPFAHGLHGRSLDLGPSPKVIQIHGRGKHFLSGASCLKSKPSFIYLQERHYPTQKMKAFRRKYDRNTLRRLIEEEAFDRTNLSFYRYVKLEEPKSLREELLEEWSRMQVLGRAYLASEGINAQLSVPEPRLEEFRKLLEERKAFHGIRFRYAVNPRNDAFLKLRVKVRPKIVADGLDDEELDPNKTPEKLNPETFHRELDRSDSIVVDVRNHYESEVGHFQGAITPESETFREELPKMREGLKGMEKKRVLLYCTGGIRCEKAGAYLRENGFENVAQLDGGVIEYGKAVREKGLSSKFMGKNFVFDERLGERITDDVLTHCHQCGKVSDRQVNCRNEGCNLLFVQCEECAERWEGCCTPACREELELEINERRAKRSGKKASIRFNKGRTKNELPKLIREQNASGSG